jgi:palmitoyl-protein thioesterase
MQKSLGCLVALGLLSLVYAQSLPVVLLHGVASSAENMADLGNWLGERFHLTVFNLEIGNGFKTSLYTPMPQQLDLLCKTIYANDALKNGFNFIGMSQGGLLARGYVEACNAFPVHNLITLVSPHGGAFEKINTDMYSPFIQAHLSIGGYWRDPRILNVYLNKCTYLPFLNNEKVSDKSVLYKTNLERLRNFVLVWSPRDDVVNPPESGRFSFFDPDFQVIPIEETLLYKEDRLGVKYLNEQTRFHIYQTNCTHVQHRDPICFSQLDPIFKLFL